MNWRSIATCLGISDQTLYRRRIEFGLENDFTEITDKELDKQIQQTLNVTPYVGKTYVRGSGYKYSKVKNQRKHVEDRWYW